MHIEYVVKFVFCVQFPKVTQPYDGSGTIGKKNKLTQEDWRNMAETGVEDMVY